MSAIGIGAVLLAVICCAGPALLAAGALSAIGAWSAVPWVIVVLAALTFGAVVPQIRPR
ncbi:hypothetical protein ABH935_009873 [Catenulispora sp. GAS73]|uniref:hypothetical protein n=1 Tax=Catenulispora sp. GAS73 TaxID=3156269 RepID=UPI003512B203